MKWGREGKILAFLFFATVLNYMDRQTLSITSPVLQKEFSLDNQQLGLLFSAFYLSYAVSVAFVGEIIDRVSHSLGICRHHCMVVRGHDVDCALQKLY